MSKYKMFTAGPVDVDASVLNVMAEPIKPHFGPGWMPIFASTTNLLQKLHDTSNNIIIMPGPGTVALDTAIGSLIPAGSTICIPSNGFFGKRLCDIALAYGIYPQIIPFPLGQPIDPEDVRKIIKNTIDSANFSGRPIRALAIVHHETSTGILNPLKEISKVAQEFELPIIVDAIGSLGGARIPVDEWGIDVCVSVPNKCIGAPPGVAIMSISKKAWSLSEDNPTKHGWYSDLRTWAWHMEKATFFPYPSTLPTSNIAALKQAIENIFSIGIDEHYSKHISAANKIRDHLINQGFRLFPMSDFAAPMLSVFTLDHRVNEGLIDYLRLNHNILISAGLGELKGQVLRIGHMGRAKDNDYIEDLLYGIDTFLRDTSN